MCWYVVSVAAVTVTRCLLLSHPDFEQSPSVEKLENFIKRALETEVLAQESLARTMELHHSLNICVADLEARPEAYPHPTNKEDQRRMEVIRRRDVALDQMARELQETQRTYAVNKILLANWDKQIARRRANEQRERSEQSVDHE
jgi:hypothetical protein